LEIPRHCCSRHFISDVILGGNLSFNISCHHGCVSITYLLLLSFTSDVPPAPSANMSALNFAGRSTLRQLHQSVQRNILRRHQARYESSNSNLKKGSQHASSTANSASRWLLPAQAQAWVEPFMRPFYGYAAMQKRSPLLTQLESSLVIYFLGDLSAQYVSNRGNPDASYEADRGLKALVIGGLSSIPSYKWFMFLGTHFNYASHTLSLAVKIVINQSVFTPLFNTYFFGMQALLSGATFAQAKQRVIDTVPRSWKNSWKVWPIVTAFSFTYIPPQYRNIFAGVIAIGWQTYLSWLNKSAEALESGNAGNIEPLHEEEHTKIQDMKDAAKA
jgi:protein Mpv17